MNQNSRFPLWLTTMLPSMVEKHYEIIKSTNGATVSVTTTVRTNRSGTWFSINTTGHASRSVNIEL